MTLGEWHVTLMCVSLVEKSRTILLVEAIYYLLGVTLEFQLKFYLTRKYRMDKVRQVSIRIKTSKNKDKFEGFPLVAPNK